MPAVNVRWAWLIPGVVLLLLGALWVLQGSGAVGGSAMTGQSQWIWIGGLVGLIGLAFTYRGLAGGGGRA
ncbi:MAG TPA: hypothetical protein VNK05_04445 [Chloroflexota bacterium]|nr:hypothetical protein [Chloroflexota bacterium]